MNKLNINTEEWLEGLGIEKPDELVEDVKKYDCEICKDTGYYSHKVYSEVYDTELREIKECECLAKIQSRKYLASSGINLDELKKINDFNTDAPYQKEIKDKAVQYVTSDSREWFAMLGSVGSGKTHICSAVLKTLIDKGLRSKYVTWSDFTDEINRERYDGGNVNIVYDYQSIPVLYIDDFLKGRYTDHDLTIAYRVINYRYNNNLTTLISSEMSLEDIYRIDSAIGSRIKQRAGDYLIELPKDKAKDYRLKGRD